MHANAVAAFQTGIHLLGVKIDAQVADGQRTASGREVFRIDLGVCSAPPAVATLCTVSVVPSNEPDKPVTGAVAAMDL